MAENNLTPEQLEIQAQLNKLYEDRLTLEKQRLKTMQESARLAGEELSHRERTVAMADAEIAARQEALEFANQTETQIVKEIEYLKNRTGLQGQAEEVRQREIEQLEKLLTLKKEDPETLEKLKEIHQQTIAQNEALKKRVNIADDLADKTARLLGVSDSLQNTMEGQLLTLARQKGGFTDLAKSMANKFSMDNVALSMITKVTEATALLLKEQDSAIASFKQATGAGDAYNDIIIDSQINLRTYGVSSAQAAQATGDLFKGMSDFSEMNKAAQQNLVETTALLDRFGIGSAEAAQSLEFLNKGLGMTAEQSAAAARDMVGLGQALNVPPEVIFSQFGQAASQLAAHGGNMIQVFEGLAAAAKASGAEMSTLLSLTGQFDTFTQGATAVGKLNALLGGPYLNTIQMLNATEDERIGIILKSLEASGKQFNELGKFEKMAIANAAGIQDMAEANKILGMSSSEYDVMRSRAEAATMSEEKFKKVTQDAMSVVEKFTTIAKNFAMNLSFLLKPLGFIADQVLAVQKALGDMFGVLVLGTGVVLFFAGKVIGLTSALTGLASAAAGGVGKALESLGTSMGKAGAGATKGALGMLAFGAAVFLVGAGIWLAASSTAELVDAFGRLSDEQIQQVVPLLMSMSLAFGVLTVALMAVAAIGSSAILPLLAIGAAVLMIGGGIWIATQGMIAFTDALARNADNLDKVFESANKLVPLIATMQALSVGAGAALLMMGTGFAALAVGLRILPLDKLKALGQVFEMLKQLRETTFAEAEGATGGINPFGNTLQAINDLDEDKIQLAQQVIEMAKTYNMEATATATTNLETTNSLLRQILDKLDAQPGATADVIAATIGDIRIVQQDQVTGRAQTRTSIARRRVRPGEAATLTSG